MSQSTSPATVMAFIDPGPTQEQIRAALESDQELRLLSEEHEIEHAAKSVYTASPDIILVDHQVGGRSSLDTVDSLAAQYPEIPIVALLEGDGNLLAQQYLLAGVRAFMIKPFTQISFLSTLRRVRELEARRRVGQAAAERTHSEQAEPLQVLTVFSPRGGVGCSTIAINLAVALHEQLDVRVLLVEGKMVFGHLGLMLNLRPQNTIADLIPHSGALEDSLIEEVVSHHASGIHVLLSSPDLNVGQGIRPDDLYRVVKAVSRLYDIVIIDAGSFLNDNTVTLMDAADKVLLVTTPDLAALHDTSRFVQLGRTLGFPSDKVLTVLNRAGVQGGIKVREIESALHQLLFAKISNGDGKVLRSLNRGVPLLLSGQRNKMGQEIRSLALKLGMLREGVEVRPAKRGVPKRAKSSAPTRRKRGRGPAQSQEHAIAP